MRKPKSGQPNTGRKYSGRRQNVSDTYLICPALSKEGKKVRLSMFLSEESLFSNQRLSMWRERKEERSERPLRAAAAILCASSILARDKIRLCTLATGTKSGNPKMGQNREI